VTSRRRNEWKITKVSNSARKNIEALDSNSQKALIKNLDELQNNPFQKDVKKVEGKKNIYRGRKGNMRYYFRINSEAKSIEILMVNFRGQIKRKSIQKMKY
jgi:mRNA-degrading endonuclease RelE of RelBE toxin-antitoxin system